MGFSLLTTLAALTATAVCISSCLSASVPVAAPGFKDPKVNGTETSILKSNPGTQETCNSDSDCFGINPYCFKGECGSCGLLSHWDGERCITCDSFETWDSDDKECVGIDDDDAKLAVGVIIALAVGIPLLLIISICCCCCCCAGCAGHAYRQRRNNKQPTQIIINGNPAYPQQNGAAAQQPKDNRH